MSILDNAHGVPHQLNVLTLDKHSDVTGKGAHCRLIVFGEVGSTPQVTVREDLWPDRSLPESTDVQRRKVLNGWQRMHPRGVRLIHVSSVRYGEPGRECIEHVYRWER